MCALLHPDLYSERGKRLSVALLRYEEAKRLTAETAVERLKLPVPDGDLARKLALGEEDQALREYRNLLVRFTSFLLRVDPPPK